MRIRFKALVLLCVFMMLFCETGTQSHLRNIPRQHRKGLAVVNFKNNTIKNRADNFQPWEFGLASMIMTDMETTGLFNIISKERLKDVISEQEFQLTGMVDENNMVKIGKMTAASYILTGCFMELNGNLRIESQVFSVEKGMQLGTASVTGKTDRFFELEKILFDKVSAYLNVMLSEEELGKIQKMIETISVEASLNNYKGEITMERAEKLTEEGKKAEANQLVNRAKSSFEKAIKIDPYYEKAKKNLSNTVLSVPTTL